METAQNKDFSKPQIGPSKGIVTAEEAAEKRKEQAPKMSFFKDFKFLSQVDDYRESPMFKDLFDDPEFRRNILNAEFLEHNVKRSDFLERGDVNRGRVSPEAIQNLASKNELKDPLLSSPEQDVLVSVEDLDKNLVDNFPSFMDRTEENLRLPPSEMRANEDERINKRLKYIFQSPITLDNKDNYAFTMISRDATKTKEFPQGKLTKYTIPTFKETYDILKEDEEGITIKPDSLIGEGRDKKNETRRFFKLLSNIPGMDEVKAAEFMYAQSTGLLDQARTRGATTDFLKLPVFLARGVGEAVNDAAIAVDNTIKDKLPDTIGPFEIRKFDASEETFGVTKFAAKTLSEMTGGAISEDGAIAILAYSPDFKSTIKKEAAIGAITYAVTGVGGLTIGALRNRAFRNYVKETYNSRIFERALANATKQGKTSADLFDEYWKKNTRGFLNNFRKRMTLFSMKMDQEARGILDPKARPNVQILRRKLRLANQRLDALKKRGANVTQDALDKQQLVINRIEQNIEFESLKALVPPSFRSLFTDEAGVTLGIATMNHYYQMNSVDPDNIQPNLFLSILGGLGGVYTTEIGLKSVNGLTRYLSDNLQYLVRKDFDNPKYVGKARDVYKWISQADENLQQQIFSAVESEAQLNNLLNTIALPNGKKIIADPEAFRKSTYKLVSLVLLRNMGDKTMDNIRHSDVRNFSDNFSNMLREQADQVRVYNELATAMSDLRKARVHPDVEADEAAVQMIDTYLNMYRDYGKHLKDLSAKTREFSVKLENDLEDMINGIKVDPKNADPKIMHDYAKKFDVLGNYYVTSDIMQGFDPLDAVKRANERLSKFEDQISKSLDGVDSITANPSISNNDIYGASSLIQSKIKLKADGQFTYLKNTYGRNSGNPVYMDGTDFYGFLKAKDGAYFQEFFEEGELFAAEISRGAKNIAGIRDGVLPSKFTLLFEDAAAKFFSPENMKKHDIELREAITIAKAEMPNASDFDIWKQLDADGYDVKLPIGFDDWKVIAKTFKDKAYQKLGQVEGKANLSIYEYWVDLAENTTTGFSTDFFNNAARKSVMVGGKVVRDWKTAKGAWQDYLVRYKHGYGKTWNQIQGMTKEGQPILNKEPDKWVEEITARLTKKNLTQEEADKVVSDLGQAFGGTIVNDSKLPRFSFNDTTREGKRNLKLVQKILQKAGKQLILNSPAGAELRTSLRTKKLIAPGTLPQLRANDNFQTFLNNVDLLKISNGKNIIDKSEVEEALSVDQLLVYSDKVLGEAKKVRADISREKNNIISELDSMAKSVFRDIDKEGLELIKNFTPKFIHDSVKLGEQGMRILDAQRDKYSRLALDRLQAKSVAELNPNQATEYEKIMRNYDRGVAARLLEFVDDQTRVVNNASTPKISADPVSDRLTVTTDDFVQGDKLMELLGSGKTWGKNFRELIKRGSVDGTDEVYDNYLTIGAYMKGEKLAKVPFMVRGIPRSLEMSSWVSRAYAWNRGIIGTPFLGTETAIHAIRKAKYSMFEEMMDKPEIGDLVVKMLEEGRVPTFKENSILTKALVSIIARNEAKEEYEDKFKIRAFRKDLKDKRRKNIDAQMKDISKETFVPSVAVGKIKEKVDPIVPDFLRGD